MNKKGFTLVELLVTIAISTLVLSLGAVLMNNVIDNSEAKTVTIAHENIKKGANLYSKEFYNEIIWLNNQSCISIEQLISKGYVSKDKADNAELKYVIIEKDDNNTIVSERNSNGINDDANNKDGDLCGAIIHKRVATPTSDDICNDKLTEYNGIPQNLIKEKNDDIYKITSDSIKTATDAGDYTISVELQDNYHWIDNSTEKKVDAITGEEKWGPETKNVTCTIPKGKPILTLNKNNQPAEQTIPTEVILTSNIAGTLEIKSSNEEYATATSTELIGTPGNYTSTITIYNNANRKTNTYITITLIPTIENYKNYHATSTTYVIGDITDIKVNKPTEKTHCIETYYNSKPQTITKSAEIGYTIPDTKFTEAKIYDINVSLHPGFEWEDGSNNDITLKCEIKNLNYFVHYVGNGHTGQKYDDKTECNDDNECGLERYANNSKYNTNTKIFEHARIYEYGSSYKLAKNKFTKKGYSFAGWSKTENGNVDFTNYQSVSNLIDPTTDKHNTIVKLYAKWDPKTFTITLDKTNGTGGTDGPIYMKYDTGWYSDAPAKTTIDKITPPTKKGYTFLGYYYTNSSDEEFQVIDSTGKIVVPNNKFSGNRTIYAKWEINKVYIQYSVNGGKITPSTPENNPEYTWTTDSSGIISRATSSEAATPNFFYYNYGAKISKNGLVDYNNSNYIEITKKGYSAKSGEEWICLSGGCQKNATYDHSTQYDSSKFCDASTSNCTAVLGVNWIPKTITVKLDKTSGTGGTNGPIYMKYDTGWYSDSTATTAITSINKPTRTGYTFLGYFYKNSSGDEHKIIDSSGKIVAANNFFSVDDRTIYAKWKINKVYIHYSTNGGSITKNTTENGTKYTWTTNSNGIISRATSSEAATQNFAVYNYGGSTSTSGLANWNNANYINISKTGYGAKSGEEWICLSGACQKNKTYDHNKVYAASNFCDASSGDCTAVLGVNWVDNVKPTCTISKRTTDWDHNGVDITINCSDSGSGCTKASTKVDDLKESKTYSVTDNAGNSGSCSVSISSRRMWHKRTRTWDDCATTTTKYEGICLIWKGDDKSDYSKSGFTTKGQCESWCDGYKKVGYLSSVACDDYSECVGGYSSWGSWSGYTYTSNCSNGTTIECKYRTEYK